MGVYCCVVKVGDGQEVRPYVGPIKAHEEGERGGWWVGGGCGSFVVVLLVVVLCCCVVVVVLRLCEMYNVSRRLQ